MVVSFGGKPPLSFIEGGGDDDDVNDDGKTIGIVSVCLSVCHDVMNDRRSHHLNCHLLPCPTDWLSGTQSNHLLSLQACVLDKAAVRRSNN